MSQKQDILTHLETHDSITPKEAYRMYSIMRLADVIFKLKKDGHDITTNMIKTKQNSYASYVLEDKEK